MRKWFSDKKILAALAVMGILTVCLTVCSVLINQIAEHASLKILQGDAKQLAQEIKMRVESDREKMEAVAGILAGYETIGSPESLAHLSVLEKQGGIVPAGILTGEDVFLSLGKEYGDFEGMLDFAAEAAKAPYVSGVCGVPGENTKYIYHAVPIKRDGIILGVLYGIVDLETLPGSFASTAFGNTAEQYIVDGETGDFIMDTWHDDLGSINDSHLKGRSPKQGFTVSIREDIRVGRAGYTVVMSEGAGEYFYMYYEPVGINRWSAMVTVPERMVFADTIRIRWIIFGLNGVEIVTFLVYFGWLLNRGRREGERRKKKLAQTLYMLRVQRTLFNSYEDTSQIRSALCQVADAVTAERTFLAEIQKDRIKGFYCYGKGRGEVEQTEQAVREMTLQAFLPHTLERLSEGNNILINQTDRKNISASDREMLDRAGVGSLMMVPVLDREMRLKGILGALQMQTRWEDCILLECVARNFLMALDSVTSYHIIREMGSTDALTGLKNRNSYQMRLEEYDMLPSLAVIYMDANGLHSMNNILGHAAGDTMLTYIGDALRDEFGSQDTYRIGGDEFVVLVPDACEDTVHGKLDALRETFDSQDYHVSMGIAYRTEGMSMKELVTGAEHRMYDDKTAYYKRKGDESRVRSMNVKLERILLEKKDADYFLSIISSYFMGVYIVNLGSDEVRTIYKPPYFASMLEKSGNRFSVALQMYCSAFISAQDSEAFAEILDYDRMEQQLAQRRNLKYHYRKRDGTEVVLRICRSPEYSETLRETFWLFEEYTESKNS